MKNKNKHDHMKHEEEELKNKNPDEPSEENPAPPETPDSGQTEETAEIESLNQKIDQLQKDVETYKDAFLRKAADFENYKRRTENDQVNLIKYSGESVIVKLLPVIDDFERSLLHLENFTDTESIRNGIRLIYDNMMKIMDQQGVRKIESVGKPFDVHYHEAMMMRKTPPGKTEPHTVLEEIQPGYTYKDKVIRHAKVVVSEEGEPEKPGS